MSVENSRHWREANVDIAQVEVCVPNSTEVPKNALRQQISMMWPAHLQGWLRFSRVENLNSIKDLYSFISALTLVEPTQ